MCVCVCLSVSHLSYSRNSRSVLMKLYTVDWNSKSKILFRWGSKSDHSFPYLPPIFFTPVMHCQWQGLSPTVSNHVDRLWHLIDQRMLLGGHYTGDTPPHPSSLLFPPFPSAPLKVSQFIVAVGAINGCQDAMTSLTS